MIRSVLTLRTAPGQAGALEDFYAEHDVLTRARQFQGCRDAVLLRPTDQAIDHPGAYLVIADWDTGDDYQRWLDNPWRAALSQQLAALLDSRADEPVVGRLYEFV